MKRRTTTVVAGLVAAPLLVGSLTACNGDAKKDAAKAADSTKDAKTRVHDAYAKTFDTTKIEMSGRMDADDETLSILDEDASDKTSPTAKKMIQGSRLVVDETSSGSSLKDETDSTKENARIVWRTDSDLATITSIGGKSAYVSVDFAKIAQQTGGFTVSSLKQQVAGAPAWVGQFIDGKTLGIEQATLQSLVKASGQGAMTGQQQLTGDQRKQMMDALHKNEDANVTYTGDGDHVKAVVKLKPFVNTLVSDGKRIAPQEFTDQSSAQMTKSLDSLKDDATATADLTLSDDKLKSVSIDVMQFVLEQKSPDKVDQQRAERLKSKGKQMSVVLDLSEPSSDITAPSDAHMVSQQEIQQLMGGMRSGI